jgi:toxin YoeB
MISFDNSAFADYLQWEEEDEKIFNKINTLIKEITRDPFRGTGKPEPLKENWSGYWSRHITQEHRLIYKVSSGHIFIASCKNHY